MPLTGRPEAPQGVQDVDLLPRGEAGHGLDGDRVLRRALRPVVRHLHVHHQGGAHGLQGGAAGGAGERHVRLAESERDTGLQG